MGKSSWVRSIIWLVETRRAAMGLVLLAMLPLLAAGGCAMRYVDYTAFAAKLDAIDAAATYQIGSPDELLIHSGAVHDLDGQRVRVQADGMIDLPGYGRIEAAGRTRDEVAVALARRLREHFAEPEIDVEVLEYASQHVFVRGQVAVPGAQPYNATNTAITALAQARPTGAADPRRIQVLEPAGDGTYRLRAEVDLEALRRGEAHATDVVLRPGEVVHVPTHRMVGAAPR